ncbi:MAG: flagellar export chaperone FliS [Oscillospiraceae bacterium]|jgi:flagellar protein FliS
MNNPYQQFMKQSVSTMTPAEMLIALYDKAEQEINKAIIYIDNKDYGKASTSILKVQDIVAMLDSSLKMKYEVSENLASLYDFFSKQLITANISKDTEILKPLIPLFADLKDAFTQISRKG